MIKEFKIGDKVRLLETSDYYRESLFSPGSQLNGDGIITGIGIDISVDWEHEGVMYTNSYLPEDLTHDNKEALQQEESIKPIKSDGGSSSYYDIRLPKWLLDIIQDRVEDGAAFIKTEELIEVLGNDFDEANILKCLVRINSLKNGCGKEGNSVEYDANKIIYSANRLKEREQH